MNPSCLTKAFTFAAKHTVIRKDGLVLEKVRGSTLARPLVYPVALGPCAYHLLISCITTVFAPAYPPRVSCLTGSKELLESGATLLSHPAFLSPSSPPLWVKLPFFFQCPICSKLSVSNSRFLIPFCSSLHLPNKIKQKKNRKIKFQFSSLYQLSPNLTSCLFSGVPNPSISLPHSLPSFLNFRLLVCNRWFK